MEHKEHQAPEAVDRFSQIIGHSRYIVLLAVIAVLLVALSLFLIGAIEAIAGIWRAWSDLLRGDLGATRLTVQFLEVVSVMLKAVVFTSSASDSIACSSRRSISRCHSACRP